MAPHNRDYAPIVGVVATILIYLALIAGIAGGFIVVYKDYYR